MKPLQASLVAGSFLGACGVQGPVVTELEPAELLIPAAVSVSSHFGGSYAGLSYWLSTNSRLAVIYQWRDDTNGDGRVSITIGYHGEMEEDEPSPFVVEPISGRVTKYDDFLSAAHGRWIAMRRGDDVIVIDAERDTSILISGNGIARGDGNECAGPRSVLFDPYRPRIGVLYEDPDRFVIRDLHTGDEMSLAAGKDRLWRAAFTVIEDIIVLYYVPEEGEDTLGALPRQRTTCSTRLGTSFAASYSFLGWDGPPYYAVVAHKGKEVRFPGDPVVLADDLVLDRDSLFDLTGAPIRLPPNCADSETAPGASTVLLQCRGTTHLWDPRSNDLTALSPQVRVLPDAYAFSDERGGTWIPVRIADTTGLTDRDRLGRLRLQDGRLEVGPLIEGDVEVAESGWIVAQSATAVHALNLSTSRHVSAPTSGDVYLDFPFIGHSVGKVLLMDPVGGTFMELDDRGAANDSGCVVVAAGRAVASALDGTVERGPWQVQCALRRNGGS